MSDVTRILNAIERGDARATDELLPLVYEELRLLAAQKLSRETPGQTLQATALVHEAYLRLVGENWGSIAVSYCTGSVNGAGNVGGLVGCNRYGRDITSSFWDIETSGQPGSAGGTGKTIAEMQRAKTFLDAGWDFVDEAANGAEDIWWIDEGKDYPHLWWELSRDSMAP